MNSKNHFNKFTGEQIKKLEKEETKDKNSAYY